MASSIPSILGRKVLPVAAIAATANFTSSGGVSSFLDDVSGNASRTIYRFDGMNRWGCGGIRSSCEAPPAQHVDTEKSKDQRKPAAKNNPFLAQASGTRETILRKRMTSIGRFSLKSETIGNLSIPTFFLALSGEKKKTDEAASSNAPQSLDASSQRKIFTVTDFETAWMERDMPSRHPRFHSTVSPQDDRYFEETHHHGVVGEKDEDEPSRQIKAELDRHASETMHFSVYREDLRKRLEHMLTSPIEVSDKLWEVKISNGLLGSSGAISRAKVEALLKSQVDSAKTAEAANTQPQQQDEESSFLRRQSTSGRIWGDVAKEAANVPRESLLLFRSHHALADGASIMAALSDLCDEAEEIRSSIELEMKRWKRRGAKGTKKSAIQRILSRLARLLKLWLWFTFGSLRAFLHQGYLQITTLKNPFDAVREDAARKGVILMGRSISWCDAAPLDEVKRVADILGKSKGGAKITVNDVFVSCVSAAITRQLIEHEEFMAPVATHARKCVVPNINVVIPVHLRGGVILPNESVGNNIGAFVARVPGEMKHDAVGGGTPTCPTERLLRVHTSMAQSKRSPAPFVSHYIAKFCSDYLPENWTKSMFQRANANACAVVSNTRGYHKKLHINGMAVESAAGFLPLPPGIPIGIVVQSYAGVMSLSIAAEKWAVPDADKFLRWTVDEYQRLRDEAMKLDKNI